VNRLLPRHGCNPISQSDKITFDGWLDRWPEIHRWIDTTGSIPQSASRHGLVLKSKRSGGHMARPVTLFTGQWADLPLKDLAPMAKEMGYDGLELAL
jgi:hypothetical protein